MGKRHAKQCEYKRREQLTHTGSANQDIAVWLSQLDRALSNGDIEAAMELFLPDSYWRDIIAFTWNIHTAEGPDAIREMLQACLHHTRPGGWQADEAARRLNNIVEGAFTFNTASGRGLGVVRIKDGRCWTGLMGRPNIPAFRGASSFKGEQLHSSALRTCRAYAGQRCVIVGADVSGHDICAALWEAGADVTMVQRSPTIIVQRDSLMSGFQELYSDEAHSHGITPEKADLLFASVPFRLMERQQAEVFSEIRRRDADFYQQLEHAGFQLSYGKDGSGLVPQIFRRGAGYYINVGASELIIRGDIKLRSRVEIEAINERGLQLSDGSELAADVIIYATGYDREKHPAWQILCRRGPRTWLAESTATAPACLAILVHGTASCGTCGSRRTSDRYGSTSEASYNLAFTPGYWRYRSKRVKPEFKHPFTKFRKRAAETTHFDGSKSTHSAILLRPPRFIQRRAELTRAGDTVCR
jgi:hypothetical protein